MSIPPHQPPAMEAKTSNTTTTVSRENSRTSTAHAEAGRCWPELFTDNGTRARRDLGIDWALINWYAERIKEQEREMEMEMENKTKAEIKECKERDDGSVATTTGTTAAPTWTQILALQAAHHTFPKTIKIEKSFPSSATMHTKITTSTDKVMKAPRTRISHGTFQHSQCQSMHNMESQKKDMQDKANSSILKPKSGAGVTKKTTIKELRSGIMEKSKPKVKLEKGAGSESITTTATTTDKVTKPPHSRAPCKVLCAP